CALLKKEGIEYAGAGANLEEAYRAWRCEKARTRISVICVAENEFGIAGPDKPGAAGIQMGLLRGRIVEEKGQSDFVVVVVHGGNENNPFPSPGAQERYRLLVDFGADAIVGMHPHCPQGYEFYRGTPIVYSVETFISIAEKSARRIPPGITDICRSSRSKKISRCPSRSTPITWRRMARPFCHWMGSIGRRFWSIFKRYRSL
ncbi:MAG: CapA family protein, partial [Clostridia bacterium]